MKKSTITIEVGLDDEQIPEKMSWIASAEMKDPSECKAFLLSIFDKENQDTLKIDLWTKEMQIQEMDRFFYHTLKAMVGTYRQATNNEKLSMAMADFVEFFGKEIGFLAPD